MRVIGYFLGAIFGAALVFFLISFIFLRPRNIEEIQILNYIDNSEKKLLKEPIPYLSKYDGDDERLGGSTISKTTYFSNRNMSYLRGDSYIFFSKELNKYVQTLVISEGAYLNKDLALLNRSFLDCPKGGKITIIMDPVIAQKAADFITSNNTEEYLWQAGSQLVMGFIGGVTAGTSAIAVGVSAIISGVMYFPSEWLGDTDWGGENVATASSASAMATDVVAATTGAVITNTTGGVITDVGGTILNADVGGIVQGVGHEAVGRATGNASQAAGGILSRNVGHYGLKSNGYQGYKGIAGFIANIAIGTYADNQENKLADETKRVAEDFNESDKSNGINVIALDV